ncbi:MAG: hypothetical protein BWY52_02384 [Chloroflexi bacterium ADurb.Bin325]|nr:MAG: hypothetical protein BWY52_02384 [Chloroflexi bacterium ADurb.Bin325]
MSPTSEDRLYNLLPAIYRIRDAEQGQPLRVLMGVLEQELLLVEQDIDRLYDNWFIETCAEWLVPYIGDLLGVRNLRGADAESAFSQRAFVANTLAYRRRKGTAAVLERLARDITGWPAVAVEFFERLGWTQYMKHIRPDRGGTASIRGSAALELVDGPFDLTAHTVDVRHIDGQGRADFHRGDYNIPNLGLFLWRLSAYRIPDGAAAALGGGRFTFHPFGYDQPLFNPSQTSQPFSGGLTELNVPAALRRRPLYDELAARRAALAAGATPVARYFGDRPALTIAADGPDLTPEEIAICDLSDWRGPTAETFTRARDASSYTTRVAVDPVLGRLLWLGDDPPAALQVSYTYAAVGDLGGGPYDRRQAAAATEADTVADPYLLEQHIHVPGEQPTLAAALQAWADAGFPACVIEVGDNATHALPAEIALGGDRLVIQAANGQRPALTVDAAGLTISGGSGHARLTLNGLLIGGDIHVIAELASLEIVHCTLVRPPGKGEARLEVAGPNARLDLILDRAIAGALRVPATVSSVTLRDTILDAETALAASDDAAQPGPPAFMERTTLLGRVHVVELTLASECIFEETVQADRRQAGCVRYSFVRDGSQTPRRFRCQPDLALGQREAGLRRPLTAVERSALLSSIRPAFTSRDYAHPGYAQLSVQCCAEIRTGAEDGGEMGAYHFLQTPLREADLRAALAEYLRTSTEAGLFFVN